MKITKRGTDIRLFRDHGCVSKHLLCEEAGKIIPFDLIHQHTVDVRSQHADGRRDKKQQCRFHLFPGGYQLIENRTKYNVPFRVVTCYESEKAYIFVLINNNMMVFNKEIFGENNPLVREIFIANMGQGRRYFLVDENGKVISSQARYNESK